METTKITKSVAQDFISGVQQLLARANHREGPNYDLRYDIASLLEDLNIPELCTYDSDDGKEIVCEGPRIKVV